MVILFDHSTPAPLAARLIGHQITKAKDIGWDQLSNGDLISAAENAGFEVFITADNSIRYQQNLKGRQIAILVISTPQWPRVRLHLPKIIAALSLASTGAYIEVDIPFE
jgi:hypothetical protein